MRCNARVAFVFILSDRKIGTPGMNGRFWREATFMRNGPSKLANAQVRAESHQLVHAMFHNV